MCRLWYCKYVLAASLRLVIIGLPKRMTMWPPNGMYIEVLDKGKTYMVKKIIAGSEVE